MARSGTSAITRLLALLGVQLGSEGALMPAAGENAKGFFEHRPMMRINKQLLERLGGSWSEPPRLPDGWQWDAGLDDLRAQARELIAAEFAGARLWGFKDPRTSLTLPFWDELLGEARYVICHRRPLDSARSLEKRNGIRLDEGVELWTRYTASALAHTAGRRRILVGYEELFTDREALVRELADFLGVAEQAESPRLRAEVEGWIEEGLRHHAGTLRELLEHPAVSAQAQALHLLLGLSAASRRDDAVSGGCDDALDGMARTLLRRADARAALAPMAAGSLAAADRDSASITNDPSHNGYVSRKPLQRREAPTGHAVGGIDASIVVVFGDDPWGAMACMESLAELAPGSPPHEMVLVDNASLGLRATLDALVGDVQIVYLPERVSVIAALRAGAEVATGEVVVCLPAPALFAADAFAVMCNELCHGLAAVASVDPEAHMAHPTAAHALALRRDALPALELPALDDVPDEQIIAALCLELAGNGMAPVCVDAHVSSPPTPICRRGPGVEQIEVSVVIPTLDGASREVRECLRAVQATIRVPHEIVVVDNGAPPQGFTAPVNAALRAARGRHLVVMNDDVRVLDGWWEPLADALDGGAPLVFPLTVEGRMRWEFAAWCFAMRRETFEDMASEPHEFFDPSMVLWCQDIDLRKRLSARGTPPLCVPESRIRHVGSRTVRVAAPHHALRLWIHAQAAGDTEVFRARYPQESGAREQSSAREERGTREESGAREHDGLPPASPILTPEHLELALAEDTLRFRADGPAWESHTLAWPHDAGHFFLAGEMEVRSPDSVQDILVRAVFADDERELYWMDLVPGVLGTGRIAFTLPRERARPIRLAPGEAPADWSRVCTVRLCARSRLRGALHRAPDAPGATTAVLTNLRLLALPAEVLR
jgi:hypothetical protein